MVWLVYRHIFNKYHILRQLLESDAYFVKMCSTFLRPGAY